MTQPNTSSPLLRFAWLSVGAASATILLKGSAFLLTNSVGLLSDALESIVNLIGAVMMLVMLTIAARRRMKTTATAMTRPNTLPAA